MGIRAQQSDNQWKIKRLFPGGISNNYDIKPNDYIKEIGNELPDENQILSRWLIVEQTDSLTIIRDKKEITLHFESNITNLYGLAFSFSIGLAGFIYLLLIMKKQSMNRSGIQFFFFFIFTFFSILAVIPSSIGDNIGRLVIIAYVSLCPMFLEVFLSKRRKNRINFFTKRIIVLFVTISSINIVLSFISLFATLPYIILEYLAQGIFYIMGIQLIFVVIENIILNKNKKIELNDSVNLPVLSVLAFVPLFICYIVPGKWEVPFFLVIPFTILPILGILHMLITSRYIINRFKFSAKILYFITSIILSTILSLIILLNEFIPIYILYIYSFLLLYFLFPLVEDTLIKMKKKPERKNAISLFSAVEDERENISLYIHDTVLQEVIYLMKEIKEQDIISKRAVINELDDIIFNLRELCSDIYPLMIQEVGLKNTIFAMTNQLEKKHPVIITNNFSVDDINFSPQKNNFVFRAVREFMNNSILHGHATEIQLEVNKSNNDYYFIVQDNGNFVYETPNNNFHFGLNAIKEKLELLNGSLNIATVDNTVLIMKLPIEN